MGNFGDGFTQGWDVWGQNPDGGLQLYIYNYNFENPQAYLDYLKTIYEAGQPMKLYYACEPKTIDITNTQLAQELLAKVKPVQVAGARSVIVHDTSPGWIGGTCPISATCVYNWQNQGV